MKCGYLVLYKFICINWVVKMYFLFDYIFSLSFVFNDFIFRGLVFNWENKINIY